MPDDPPLVKPEGWFGTRHVLGIMGFLGFANIYAMRVNFSVAIVAMSSEFHWDEKQTGAILGCFFAGYFVTNPIGGRLGERFGGKIVLGVGVFLTALLTLITPVAAKAGRSLLIVTRVLIGAGEGVTFPAMNALMARWVPPLERSKMSSLVYAGTQLGTVFSLSISGLLSDTNFLGGWPKVFYVFGTLGVLWCLAWALLVHSDPEDHPRIALDEKVYIQQSLRWNGIYRAPPIPVRCVLTSMPFWAILVAHTCQNWGLYTFLTELPNYMKNILHFRIGISGCMSALPYLLMWLFSLASGQLADYLRSTGILTTTTTRRVFNSLALCSPMVCFVLVGYTSSHNKTLAVVLLCIGIGLNGAYYSGFMSSHLDIAPNFAGTLMGLTNSAATVPGFLAPLTVGQLINENDTVEQWQLVFWICAAIYFFGNTFYVIFVSGEVQYWNNLADGNSRSWQDDGRVSLLGSQYQTFAAHDHTQGVGEAQDHDS